MLSAGTRLNANDTVVQVAPPSTDLRTPSCAPRKTVPEAVRCVRVARNSPGPRLTMGAQVLPPLTVLYNAASGVTCPGSGEKPIEAAGTYTVSGASGSMASMPMVSPRRDQKAVVQVLPPSTVFQTLPPDDA